VASVASAASSRSRPTKDSSRCGRREAGGRRAARRRVGAGARRGRVVAEDPGLQVAQLRPGLQPQLLGQDPAGVAEGRASAWRSCR
jgi:hypothetical protein